MKYNIIKYKMLMFKKRGSPYVHSFKWIFNTLNIQNIAAYTQFVMRTINS